MPETLYTPTQASELLGIKTCRVRQVARQLHVGRSFSSGNRTTWLFTAEDIEVMRGRRRTPGKPKLNLDTAIPWSAE